MDVHLIQGEDKEGACFAWSKLKLQIGINSKKKKPIQNLKVYKTKYVDISKK
jgi:hypothetical protein